MGGKSPPRSVRFFVSTRRIDRYAANSRSEETRLNEQSLAHALVLAYDKDDPNKTTKALAAVLKERLEEVRKELEVDTNTSD